MQKPLNSPQHILLVAATLPETTLVRSDLKLEESPERDKWVSENDQVTLLHTGVGMVNTAWRLGQYLLNHRPDLSLNFGIAGAFDPEIAIGEVVEVVEETFGDLGADSPTGILGLEEMGLFLAKTDTGGFVYNQLRNPSTRASDLKRVKGSTVNLVSGQKSAIGRRYERWPAQIETMESAAFFYLMLMEKCSFQAFRGISNRVEPRNRSRWRVQEANEAVQQYIINLVKGYLG